MTRVAGNWLPLGEVRRGGFPLATRAERTVLALFNGECAVHGNPGKHRALAIPAVTGAARIWLILRRDIGVGVI